MPLLPNAKKLIRCDFYRSSLEEEIVKNNKILTGSLLRNKV